MADISSRLIRRVAEAADGYRTGEPVWIVSGEAPVDAVEVFDSEAEAQTAAAKPGAILHGPFVTETDDFPPVTPISVTVRLSDGTTRTIDLEESIDALFFSQPAIDKFVGPYYTQVYGGDMASRVLALASESEFVIFGHDRNTRWLPK